jgi:hypothetical protein
MMVKNLNKKKKNVSKVYTTTQTLQSRLPKQLLFKVNVRSCFKRGNFDDPFNLLLSTNNVLIEGIHSNKSISLNDGQSFDFF